jgi:hypothetical protein
MAKRATGPGSNSKDHSLDRSLWLLLGESERPVCTGCWLLTGVGRSDLPAAAKQRRETMIRERRRGVPHSHVRASGWARVAAFTRLRRPVRNPSAPCPLSREREGSQSGSCMSERTTMSPAGAWVLPVALLALGL